MRAKRLVLLLLLLGFAAGQPIHAQTYTVLYRFGSPRLHGAHPNAGVIMDAAGNLYGTTNTGGSAKLGTVFKLDPSGNETVLHSFLGGADGAHPITGLVPDPAGNLYGTTRYGGTSNLGTVFKVDPSGNETVIHTFSGADGTQPLGSLVRDTAGNLYGTTFFGGVHSKGTVFKVDPAGNETVLHSFTGGVDGSDGAHPAAGLFQGSDGNLYGTTRGGGFRQGTIFAVNPSGGESLLFSFPFGTEGAGIQPVAGVIVDSAGNIYGTTPKGGSSLRGVVFKFDQDNREETVLRSFSGADGWDPQAGLVRDAAGNLYGTTAKSAGTGTCNCGVVFKLDPTGAVTVLHTFQGNAFGDGQKPVAGLLLDSLGNLYGTTQQGGIAGGGVVFKITP